MEVAIYFGKQLKITEICEKLKSLRKFPMASLTISAPDCKQEKIHKKFQEIFKQEILIFFLVP